MNALLIDPSTKSVTAVAVDPLNALQSLYTLIGCTYVEAMASQCAVLYVDENPPPQPGFVYNTHSVRGRAVVVGPANDDGDDTPVTVTAAAVEAAIRWV